MTQKNLRGIILLVLFTWALIFLGVGIANAVTVYQIKGTDTFTAGIPTGLSKTERAYIVAPLKAVTEASCKSMKCDMVENAVAKTQIKKLIELENIPIPAKCPDGTIGTPPNCVTPPAPSYMPTVDLSKQMKSAIGFSDLRVAKTTEIALPSHGEVRVPCTPSHMSNDDPIVYPNQQGAAHHHTFFGNTSLNYKSDLSNLANVGNSTCNGGIMNRSAYWIPSIIDAKTNTPIVPDEAIFYYKVAGDASLVKAPPKGLRMIAGNMKNTTAEGAKSSFKCYPGANSKRTDWPNLKGIPTGEACGEVGDLLEFTVAFPTCWDGKNLDSPNHQDHMAFLNHRPVNPPNDFYCPATHPVLIPAISTQVKYYIKEKGEIDNWRLSSDNYKDAPAGYSAHADYVEGWNRDLLEAAVKNCLNAKKDGHAHLLCDGRMFY